MNKQAKSKRTKSCPVGRKTYLTAAYLYLLSAPMDAQMHQVLGDTANLERRCGPVAAAACRENAAWMLEHGGTIYLDDGLVLNVCVVDPNHTHVELSSVYDHKVA